MRGEYFMQKPLQIMSCNPTPNVEVCVKDVNVEGIVEKTAEKSLALLKTICNQGIG